MQILITAIENPPGKLCEVELVFEGTEPLAGLKLGGWAVWCRRDGTRNVTHPARQYAVNGERRSFSLVRPAGLDLTPQDRIRQQILDAYAQWEAAQAAVVS